MSWHIQLIYSLILRYNCHLVKGSPPITSGSYGSKITQAIYGIYPNGQKWYCAESTIRQFLDRYVL